MSVKWCKDMKINRRNKMTFGQLFLRELPQEDAKKLRRAIVEETDVCPSTLWRWAHDMQPSLPAQNLLGLSCGGYTGHAPAFSPMTGHQYTCLDGCPAESPSGGTSS